ncbi:MAG: cysteine peptidase family C39 domain-containing protein [bacterium]
MKIIKFPFSQQTYNWDCGADAAYSVLVYYGVNVRKHEIMKLAGTTRAGTPVKGIKRVMRRYGLRCQSGQMTIEDIKKFIDQKIPVIVALQAWTTKENVDWANDWDNGHYAVIIGYDKSRFYFIDPQSVYRTFLTYKEFTTRWHDVGSDRKKYINFGIVAFGKDPNYDYKKIIHMN